MEPSPSAERRRWRRRPIHRAVSFCCTAGGHGPAEWILGWMEDVSTGGARVVARQPLPFDRDQRISILCLPEGDGPDGGQEAVRIEGWVAWRGGDHHCFGVQYG